MPGNTTDIIQITPQQNALVSLSRWAEAHQILVEASDIDGNQYLSRVVFWVKRIRGLGGSFIFGDSGFGVESF